MFYADVVGRRILRTSYWKFIYSIFGGRVSPLESLFFSKFGKNSKLRDIKVPYNFINVFVNVINFVVIYVILKNLLKLKKNYYILILS